VVGRTLPADHGYALYSALCGAVPELHEARWWGLHTVRGKRDGQGAILIGRHARLGLRLPANRITQVLPLAGETIEVGGHPLRLHAPLVSPLVSHCALSARAVTVKGYMEPEPFAEVVAQQLGQRGIRATIEVGSRKVVQIAGRKVVGFSLRLTGLTETQALPLMENGLGGRRRFGCGLMMPSRRALGETTLTLSRED
jgi:CRISPR-associated endonuclease/helicase Cas3